MGAVKLPFHADHVGSFIRPSSVSTAQKQADAGEITDAQLNEIQKKAIGDIVHKQQEHGVRSLCSGEYDRRFYFSGFFEKLGGFKEVRPVPWDLTRLSAAPIAALKKSGQTYPMLAVCEDKITYNQSPYLENWKTLRACVPKERWNDCKFTMPPPCYFHLRMAPGKCYNKEIYPTDADFFADLAKVYRQELKTLHSEGLRNLQIDDPTLAYFCSEDMLQGLRSDGENTDELFDMYLKAHNDCIADRPEDLHVALHICRGNFSKAMHFSEGSYEKIAEKFFKTLNYDTFYLEYDNPRSGGFEPLRFLPKDKNVVLGVVTTKDPTLEDKAVIKQRIEEAAAIIAKGQGRTVAEAMENIGISPQCGFASVAIGADGMTEEKMFAKLQLVRDVASELWPDKQ